MTSNDGRPGVVGAGAVASFGADAVPAPDAVSTTATTTDGAVTTSNLPTEPLEKITAAVHAHFEIWRREGWSGAPTPQAFPPHLNPLLPYALSLKTAVLGDGSSCFQYAVCSSLTAEQILPVLQGMYGDFLFETDLPAAMEIDKSQPKQVIALSNLGKYIPEFVAVQDLDGKKAPSLSNPYLILLMTPPDKRAFLAGAMEIAEKRNVFAALGDSTMYNNQMRVPDWTINAVKSGITLLDILAYASRVKERNIKQYVDALASLNA